MHTDDISKPKVKLSLSPEDSFTRPREEEEEEKTHRRQHAAQVCVNTFALRLWLPLLHPIQFPLAKHRRKSDSAIRRDVGYSLFRMKIQHWPFVSIHIPF